MRKKIHYKDEPMAMEVVPDFLPPPERLVLKEETVKVTLSLSKPTLEFFKRRARRQQAKYQRMIRRVLDLYASHYR
jgi:hypothetical protein